MLRHSCRASATAFVGSALTAAFLVSAPALSGQTGSMRVSVPSPTAASLGKFGDVPVSLASGLPDISIPLFTVQGHTLELPITLRYAAGGIRVEEIGSWVGLGWSLDAGGVITRTVRGVADEDLKGYWHTGHTWYGGDSWFAPTFDLIGEVASGQIDGEPDQFFFNFPGHTGQFVMGPVDSTGTKAVGLIPHQRMRIEVNDFGDEDSEFVVTTADGTRYTFAGREITTDASISEPSNIYASEGAYPSSWYLTEIEAPGGDRITLHYGEYTAQHQHTTYVGRNAFIVENPPGSCVPSQVSSINIREIQALHLDSIVSARHTVRFEHSLRADALHSALNTPQEPRLDRIVVLTPGQSVVRTFDLDYDYFPGGRLRLLGVQEQAPGEGPLPPWTFSYDPQTFPDRDSKAQDHWGYWNGAANSTLVPPVMTPHGIFLQGGDRNPNPSTMTVGTLTGITYPTGGSTAFTWEANDYGRIGSDSAHVVARGPWQLAQASSPEPAYPQADTFTVGGVEPTLAFVNVQMVEDTTCNVQCGWVSIEGVTSWTESAQVQMMLSPGTYVLYAEAGGTDPNNPMFAQGRVDWQDLEIAKKAPAGGLRLARFETEDGLGGVQVRTYRYTLAGDTLRSSGLLPVEPRYHYNFVSSPCSYFSRSSMSRMPLGGGAPVEYSEVTVLLGEDGEFGSRRETFRTFTDEPDDAAPHEWWPYLRATTRGWKRGQPVERVEYSAAGAAQERSRTTYAFRDHEPVTAQRFRGMSVNSFSSAGGSSSYIYSPFLVISAWYHPQSDTTTVYDEGGGDSFSTVRTYVHGNPVHTQLTELTETNPDGTERITRMRYPAD